MCLYRFWAKLRFSHRFMADHGPVFLLKDSFATLAGFTWFVYGRHQNHVSGNSRGKVGSEISPRLHRIQTSLAKR